VSLPHAPIDSRLHMLRIGAMDDCNFRPASNSAAPAATDFSIAAIMAVPRAVPPSSPSPNNPSLTPNAAAGNLAPLGEFF
jgi:hypothetical protein